MNVIITGAAGFLGRALTSQVLARWPGAEHRVVLLDRIHGAQTAAGRGSKVVVADLEDLDPVSEDLSSADVVFHLAAIPGGASEADYESSLAINLHASLNLIERLSQRKPAVRMIYASSIAVFGVPQPRIIDDDTLPLPSMTYGAHKLMIETMLANASRLQRIDGVALRLPGIVPRPAGNTGLKSAFISELFHACAERRPFVVPVSAAATAWLMSPACAANNLIRAATLATDALPRRAVTLPALRVSMVELAAALTRRFDADPAAIRFECDPALEAQFGAAPPLSTPLAESLGFVHDGDLDALIANFAAAQMQGVR